MDRYNIQVLYEGDVEWTCVGHRGTLEAAEALAEQWRAAGHRARVVVSGVKEG